MLHRGTPRHLLTETEAVDSERRDVGPLKSRGTCGDEQREPLHADLMDRLPVAVAFYDRLSIMPTHSSHIASPEVPPDQLSEILRDLSLSGVSYGRCELTSPWGIDFPAQTAARFHFVAKGECRLELFPEGCVVMRAGDMILLPHGTHHTLVAKGGGQPAPLDRMPLEEIGDKTFKISSGGGGELTLLFCCSVSFNAPQVHPLLELLPSMLVVRGTTSSDPTLLMLLEMMADEVLAQRAGAATVMTRIADLMIARVIRAWTEVHRNDATGWLAAIRDPKIGSALVAIHRRPGHPWSVASLADIAQASRSKFSERFSELLGTSPARYVAHWRMHLAGIWLREERLTVAEVAIRLGYESESSFSRAFKRVSGVPPSASRRANSETVTSVA